MKNAVLKIASMLSLIATLPLAWARGNEPSPAAPEHPGGSAGPLPAVGQSPWGQEDEIGRLNLMTDASRAAILSRIDGGRAFDLSVELFVGMPSFHGLGDPRYQFWLTHTPHGTLVDDPAGVGDEQNRTVSYTGDAVSMYTHTGTHIDALNHFGLNGKIWNGFRHDEYLGDRGWHRAGAETIPPIVARGVMIDVAAAKGLVMLPPLYRVTAADLAEALAVEQVALHEGDVVLIRTGRMQVYTDAEAFLTDPPGLSMDGAQYLAERGAMVIGADNLSLETFPSEVERNWVPVHTYLLAEQGIPIVELVNLEELSDAHVFEFAFVAASLKLRGASGAPFRPIALPVQ